MTEQHCKYSIPRHTLINFQRPFLDTAGHAGCVSETLLLQPQGDPQAANTMVAVDDDFRIAMWVKFAHAQLQFAHRDQHRTVNAAKVPFVLPAAVEKHKQIVAKSLCMNGFA